MFHRVLNTRFLFFFVVLQVLLLPYEIVAQTLINQVNMESQLLLNVGFREMEGQLIKSKMENVCEINYLLFQ